MFNSNSVKQVLFGAGLRLTLQFINSLCLKKVIVDQVYDWIIERLYIMLNAKVCMASVS